MKLVFAAPGTIELELTRRNLRSLLAKLDGFPPDSACTITKYDEGHLVIVRAVEDWDHYAARPAGGVHADTEAAIQ